MSINDPVSTSGKWVIRVILYAVALFIIVTLAQRVLFKKLVVQTIDCLDKAASAEIVSTPLSAANKYAACVGRAEASKDKATATTDPIQMRCPYSGVWASTRGSMVYHITLKYDGSFFGEPFANTPPGSPSVSGAWGVGGNMMAWVYDSGPVWPPDINPISNKTAAAFTLTEVNGETTRFTLLERSQSTICKK